MLIKRKILVAFLALFALLGSAAGASARSLSSSEASLLQTMNTVRTSRGLAPLRLDVRLLRAARGHSADMMNRQYFAHGAVAARALAQRARGPVYGEDLAWGTGVLATPQATVAAWIASPAHNRVLLERAYREVGVGVAPGVPVAVPGGATYTLDAGETGA